MSLTDPSDLQDSTARTHIATVRQSSLLRPHEQAARPPPRTLRIRIRQSRPMRVRAMPQYHRAGFLCSGRPRRLPRYHLRGAVEGRQPDRQADALPPAGPAGRSESRPAGAAEAEVSARTPPSRRPADCNCLAHRSPGSTRSCSRSCAGRAAAARRRPAERARRSRRWRSWRRRTTWFSSGIGPPAPREGTSEMPVQALPGFGGEQDGEVERVRTRQVEYRTPAVVENLFVRLLLEVARAYPRQVVDLVPGCADQLNALGLHSASPVAAPDRQRCGDTWPRAILTAATVGCRRPSRRRTSWEHTSRALRHRPTQSRDTHGNGTAVDD